jgi:hypothetical protein
MEEAIAIADELLDNKTVFLKKNKKGAIQKLLQLKKEFSRTGEYLC